MRAPRLPPGAHYRQWSVKLNPALSQRSGNQQTVVSYCMWGENENDGRYTRLKIVPRITKKYMYIPAWRTILQQFGKGYIFGEAANISQKSDLKFYLEVPHICIDTFPAPPSQAEFSIAVRFFCRKMLDEETKDCVDALMPLVWAVRMATIRLCSLSALKISHFYVWRYSAVYIAVYIFNK